MIFPLAAGIDDDYESADSDDESQYSPPLKAKSQEGGEELQPLPESFFQALRDTLDEETCMGPCLHSKYYGVSFDSRPEHTKCKPPGYIWSDCNHISVTLGTRFATFLRQPENRKWAYLGKRIIENKYYWSGILIAIQSIKDTPKALAITPYANTFFTHWCKWPTETYYLFFQELSSRSVSEIETLGQCAPQLFSSRYLKVAQEKSLSEVFESAACDKPLSDDQRLWIVKKLKDIPEEKIRLIASAVTVLPAPYFRVPHPVWPFQDAFSKHIIKRLRTLTVDEIKALNKSRPFSQKQMHTLWFYNISIKDLIKPNASE